MSQLSRDAFQRLSTIADELYETFDERGHRVDMALDADPSFGRRSRRSQSSLGRDLAIEAIVAAARRAGFDVRDRAGGVELATIDGTTVHSFRLLKGSRGPDDAWTILTNSRSALTVDDEASLLTEVRRVFSWNTRDSTISEVITARVVDHVEGSPGYLVLDQLQALGGLGGSDDGGRGFVPTDPELPGFPGTEHVGDDEREFGGASASA